MSYVPSSYRATDVWLEIREHGLGPTARRCGVPQLSLARYALLLELPRQHARQIEQTLLADAAA